MVAIPKQTVVVVEIPAESEAETQEPRFLDSYIEITAGWPRRRWRFNYVKYVNDLAQWAFDWEVVAPDGSIKASLDNDTSLALRSLNELKFVDTNLFEYEAIWIIRLHANTLKQG